MTDSTNNNELSIENQANQQLEKTTMQSLYELLGLHYYKTRAVFDVDGKELVYVNDNCVGRIKLYLEGEEIYQGWTWLPGMHTDVTARHEGHDYRVFACLHNWITLSQKVTLIVDDSKAQSKMDPILGSLKGIEVFRALAGLVFTGVCIGLVLGFVFGLFGS